MILEILYPLYSFTECYKKKGKNELHIWQMFMTHNIILNETTIICSGPFDLQV